MCAQLYYPRNYVSSDVDRKKLLHAIVTALNNTFVAVFLPTTIYLRSMETLSQCISYKGIYLRYRRFGFMFFLIIARS